MPGPAPRTIRVVAALIPDESGARFLVQQRLAGGSRGSLWEFPGGKVEPGEADQAALVREGHEELGVALEVGPLAWQTRHAYPDLTVELWLYRARIAAGTPRPLGAQALEFASPARMAELPFCEADLPLIRRLAAGELGEV